jgi:hypothetical protein
VDYIKKNLNVDSIIILIIAGLAMISVVYDIRVLRPVFGCIFVIIFPGYVLVNLIVDAVIFKWIMRTRLLLRTIIKIGEVIIGVLLSLLILPIIGLFIMQPVLRWTWFPYHHPCHLSWPS